MPYFNLNYLGKLVSKTAIKEIKNTINPLIDICKKNNFIENNPFLFNDSDYEVFYLKTANNREAVVLTEPNDSFILILDNSMDYIRCKVFKLYQTFSFEDNDEKEDYKTIIKYTNVYLSYSDNFDENKCVERPDIEFFKNNDLMYPIKDFNFSPILDEIYLLKENTNEDISNMLPNNYENTIINIGLVESFMVALKSSIESLNRKFPKEK